MDKHWSRHAYHFYDLDIESQETTLKAILEFATDDRSVFLDIVSREGFDVQSRLHVFYEALSRDLPNWSGFFFDELQRIFETAETSPHPMRVLDFLDALLFADKAAFTHRADFVTFLRTKLSHPRPLYRYHALFLLSDFVDPTDHAAIADMTRLLDDKDWRVRHWTYRCLSDLRAVPDGKHRKAMDVLKATVFDTKKFR